MKKLTLISIFLLCLGVLSSQAQIKLGYVENHPYTTLYLWGENDKGKVFFASQVDGLENSRNSKPRDVVRMRINGKQIIFKSKYTKPQLDHDRIKGTVTLYSRDGYRLRFQEIGMEGSDNWKSRLTIYYKKQTKSIVLKLNWMGD